MEISQALKRKILLFLLLSFMSLLGALAVQYYSTREDGREIKEQKQFEKVLRKKEQFTQQTLELVLRESQTHIPYIKLHRVLDHDLFQEDGLTVFLFRNDSLVFWSDNNVPASGYFEEQIFSQPFLKYGNGWFRILSAKKDNLRALGLILIKNEYPYQNKYLTNNFQEDFCQPPLSGIDTVPGKVNIHSADGDFLFSINRSGQNQISIAHNLFSFGLWLICFISALLLLFYLYHLFDFFKRYPFLLLLAFCIDALLFRFIILYFEIPAYLYGTSLFSPYYYATSFISPSLGDLVVNGIFWLTLAWIFYRKFNFSLSGLKQRVRLLVSFLLIASTAVLFYLLISTLRRMVIDSNVELNLNNIFNIDIYSGLAFLAMTSLVLAFFLATARISIIITNSGIKPGLYIGISFLTALFEIPLFTEGILAWSSLLFPAMLLLYLLSLLYFSSKKNSYNTISGALIYIVYFSLLATFVLDYFHDIKEKENRVVLAEGLSSRRDPLMEYEFMRVKNQMQTDSSLLVLVNEKMRGKETEAEIISYINERYFNGFLTNYEAFITICQEDEVLNIQPEGYLQNCHDYFDGMMTAAGVETVGPDLYFLHDKMDNNNYIASMDFSGNDLLRRDTLKIFVELFYKYNTETGLGYPDLLIDKKINIVSDLSEYSYAKYLNGKLIYKNGDFSYHLGIQAYDTADNSGYFVDYEGYSHYVLKLDGSNALIISKKTLTLLDLAAPFSYLFIIFSLSLLLFLLGFLASGGYHKLEFNFSNQLQISIIAIIIISFLILGMITRSNIIHLYNNKNRDNLSEKTFSVLTELEHKMGNEMVLSRDLTGYIAEYLSKFSQVFFSDINLYDTNGVLIASSRPQIFDEELLSTRMNTCAFLNLSVDESLLYIQNERIGKQEYLSAYIPFRNNNDQIIAYLNLPYFAKQTELRKEIADFLAAYINVYVLLIVLAIMVTILVSRFITRPLQLIREKLRDIGLGKSNEKIAWKRKDEIGSLVDEYNRMIDELERSAEMLARSERESAWREMAKQVAHEIKNPLTPMKLSVQYLQKAWDDKTPDWEKRLERFTRTIVEQIDSLSEIASEFSDFAKMPAANIGKIELNGIIKSAADLYQHHHHIRILIDHPEGACDVAADKRQLLRVFNNLIQNAVQAIGKKEEGVIQIDVFREEKYYRVEITDNGSGITDEQAEKIFSPSFTTKSSGMGLGLAMVKSIMTSINGSVSFKSDPGQGTTFTVQIPVFSDRKNLRP